MKRFQLLVFCLMTMMCGSVWSQQESVILDDNTFGTLVQVTPTVSFAILDDGGVDNDYGRPQNRHISIQDTLCGHGNLHFTLVFDQFDIASTDTLFIYDGPTVDSRLIVAANNTYHNLLDKAVYAGPNNPDCILTLRFKVSGTSKGGSGFLCRSDCKPVCEYVVPEIREKFYRVRGGEIYDEARIQWVTPIDTAGDTLAPFLGAGLCLGDSVIFDGHIEWDPAFSSGYYTPTDDNIIFRWNFGDGVSFDTVGGHRVEHFYQEIGCYDVTLSTIDTFGCASTTTWKIQARLAQNPLKTIYDLNTICNNDSLLVNVGFDGENSTITLRRISFEKVESKVNEIRTFVPDGMNCEVPCYLAPVDFTEFPTGKKIQSAEEVCSVCINFEHEFMGDYSLAIMCPNGQRSFLKLADAGHQPGGVPQDAPIGSYGGGGDLTGIPYGGDNDHHSYDGSGNNVCDSIYNPYGIGYDYCFSRNEKYTLVDGLLANTTDPGNHYLGNTQNSVPFDTILPAIPAYFNQGGTSNVHVTGRTRTPSNHLEMTDYYLPYSDFSELVGCPMNGVWNIEVCDYWPSDNGWVFNWGLDLCGVTAGGGCEYQVGIDSVTWTPDSAYGDWLTGKYRGVMVNKADSVTSYVLSPDTAGRFSVLINIYDEFGCVWDTNTFIITVWTPTPNLGNDTILCSVESTILDATDIHTATQHYYYAWEPYGQETATIETETYTGKQVAYVVEATNIAEGVTCTGRDTILVDTKLQPVPSFDPGVYPLESCEPFKVTFENNSLDGATYEWIFGDGETSDERNPTHTYLAGTYDLKYYVTSVDGCVDSLIYPQLVTVFPNPVAKYSWEPLYPTVMSPTVTMQNLTTPENDDNEYFWEFQYDVTNPYSFETMRDKDPIFEWYSVGGEKISGSYIVRLIARTTNYGPSGTKTQCIDTTENSILLVNDFLQFPNVVTPNGDGINDRFEIVNLTDGFGYPINRLEIFNKWGARIFIRENIDSDTEFWDPNETNSPDGTYYFHFVGRGYNGNVERNGVIEVVR